MIDIGIIGCGHWGPNYIRIFSSLPDVRIQTVCDSNPAKLATVKKQFHGIETVTDAHELILDPKISAIVICTPSSTHFELAKKGLLGGKHVLVEKPITLKADHAEELVQLAGEKNLILMVGHTFLYNPGVMKMKDLIDQGKLGKMYYINALRTHLGLVREDVNVVWDLAPHDVSILNHLVGKDPLRVSAIGACHLQKGREDAAFINLVYPDDIIALIQVSWADSNKQRRIQAVGSKARVVFDDLNSLERVKLFEKGIAKAPSTTDFGEFQLMLRDGDIWSPKIEAGEPLMLQCAHFLDCIRTRQMPRSDGRQGLSVVKVMCAIENSLRQGGAVVSV